MVEGERFGGVRRPDRRRELGALAEPGGERVEVSLGGRGADPPPPVAMVDGGPARLDRVEQRWRALGHRGQAPLAGRGRDELMVHLVELEPVGEVLARFDLPVLQRHDLGEELARRPHLIRQVLWPGVVVAGEQAPKLAVAPQRQRQPCRHLHVLQVFGVHDRRAPQGAVGHGEGLAGVGVDERHELGKPAGHVGQGPRPHLPKDRAGRLGNVARRVMKPAPGGQLVALALGDDFAVTVGVKAVDHRAIEAREGAQRARRHVAELRERGGALQPGDGLLDEPVVVGLAGVGSRRGFELDHHHAVNRVHADVERRHGPARRQREHVERVVLGRLARQTIAQARLDARPEGGGDGPTEQPLGRVVEPTPRVLARLQHRQVGEPQHQQHPVILHAARGLHRLGVAIRDGDAVTLDAVRLALPRQARGRRFDGHAVDRPRLASPSAASTASCSRRVSALSRASTPPAERTMVSLMNLTHRSMGRSTIERLLQATPSGPRRERGERPDAPPRWPLVRCHTDATGSARPSASFSPTRAVPSVINLPGHVS